MSVADLGPWQWVTLLQHELLLFAGVFFLLGALDDLAIDAIWLWLKATGRSPTQRRARGALQGQELHAPAAVLIPAWHEAAVIGSTIGHILASWPQQNYRLYIGCYRNDPATIAAVRAAGGTDERLALVIIDRDGPTTKADCLNGLYAAMIADEACRGLAFGSVLFHDAEDMVDPAGLALLDEAIAGGADFAQLPVEPMVPPRASWFARQVAAHYCEEFAEAHAKGMVVRDAVGAALPAAGVGCAVSRRGAAAIAAQRASGLPFASDSLTEDYELGLAIGAAGGCCRFVRVRGEDGRLIATRAFFPARFDRAVRQKSRWVLGIALQGWDRVGWSGGIIERWMRARDRRGPLTALVLLTGYLLVVLTGLGWIGAAAGWSDPIALTPALKFLLIANGAAFAWRAVARFAFTTREYGVREGLLAVARIPLANVIAIIASRRAVWSYVQALGGRAASWDKTEHDLHPAQFKPAGVVR